MKKFKKDEISKILDASGRADRDRLLEVWDLLDDADEASRPIAEDEVVRETTAFPDPGAIERVWSALEEHSAVSASVRATNGYSASAREIARPATSRIPAPRGEDRRALPPRPRRLPGSLARRWAVAASVVLGVAIAVLALYPRTVTVTADPGQRLALVLPDGSGVELNSGTSLRYNRKFGSTRLVELDGEAFFDVTTSESPFVVRTFNAQVRVLGTKFNVRSWTESIEPGTTVTLESGRVQFSSLDGSETVDLTPGQTHLISRSINTPSLPDVAEVERALAWRAGDLVFKDEWLGIVLEDIERRFDVTITVDPQSIARRQVTVAARNPETADGVLADLALGLELSYRRTANGWELYSPH